jgi:octaprenyl-diphosphate synthase
MEMKIEKDSPVLMGIDDVFGLIKDDLRKVEESFKITLDSNVYLISKVGEYILRSGGKRFRPMLLLLSARLCGYTGEHNIPFAGVVEFIHTATLLHDDVVDNANLRRGNASANTVWGDGASILVGDYLLSRAFSLAVASGDMRILEVLSNTTTRMAEGEVLQLIKHSDPGTTEEEYLDVVTNKTAVLISASAEVAAMLGGVSADKRAALAAYGMGLGRAYQLMDDCLDYVSSDEELGKPVGNDLTEGKVTMPLIHAMRRATGAERDVIRRAVEADSIEDAELAEVIGIINSYGGIEYTLDRARSYIEEAQRRLDIFEPSVERTALVTVADYVIERTF